MTRIKTVPRNRFKTLGETIKDARIAASVGLRELAGVIEVSPSYVSDIEHDRRVPAEDVLQRIASHLGLEFEKLMSLAGRLGEETERYLKRHPEAVMLLRSIAEADLDESEIAKLSALVDSMV